MTEENGYTRKWIHLIRDKDLQQDLGNNDSHRLLLMPGSVLRLYLHDLFYFLKQTFYYLHMTKEETEIWED